MAKKALGKGLGALISNVSQRRQDSTDAVDETSAEAASRPQKSEPLPSTPPGSSVEEVPIGSVVPSPFQPRTEFRDDQLSELMETIREHGIIQPLVVRKVGDDLELIAGERRLRAAKKLKLKKVPVITIERSDRDVLEMALIENLQREDLNPIEEAEAFQRLSKDFGLTQEEIAKKVGKNRATVANTIRLLDLSPSVRKMVAEGRISAGHAKVILGLKHHSVQKMVADKVVSDGLTVRQAEQEVSQELAAGGTSTGKRRSSGGSKSSSGGAEISAAISRVEERLRSHFASQVSLRHGDKKGRIEIEYYGNEDLERVLELMGVDPDFS